MNQNIYWVLWLIATFVLCPILPGIINKVKAFFAGRKGPSIFQLYYDLNKLLKKGGVISNTSGGMLKLAPCISLASIIIATLLLPLGIVESPFSFQGDVILFFYLLGTARLVTVWGALDTGSSFEGMGASREMQFSALAEAAIFGIIGCLAVLTQRGDLSMLPSTIFSSSIHTVAILLCAFAFFIILLMENCRVPADDPNTHLELTMIHEAMILDYAGPDLALILYGASLKLWLFASFFVMLLIPALSGGLLLSSALFLAGIILTVVLVGIIESCIARYRFLKVPQMLIGALGLSLIAFFFLIFFNGGVK
ncbi:MAG: NADH-quinone oxidoreductase subunit H [Lentisphaeria bacterium]|nr:NADH-quinone oxidoreductase subunit H [Lentisphaeria bacterium]